METSASFEARSAPWSYPANKKSQAGHKSAWGKRSAVKCRPSREFREAGLQIPNGIAAEMGRYRKECHGNLGQVLR